MFCCFVKEKKRRKENKKQKTKNKKQNKKNKKQKTKHKNKNKKKKKKKKNKKQNQNKTKTKNKKQNKRKDVQKQAIIGRRSRALSVGQNQSARRPSLFEISPESSPTNKSIDLEQATLRRNSDGSIKTNLTPSPSRSLSDGNMSTYLDEFLHLENQLADAKIACDETIKEFIQSTPLFSLFSFFL